MNSNSVSTARTDQHITKPDLKVRGWTDGLISQFLGAADCLKPNPIYRSGPQMHLYSLSRVEAAEATPQFNDAKGKMAARRAKASVAQIERNIQRRKTLLAWVDELEIKIPEIAKDRLREKAVEHFNLRQAERGRVRDVATLESDPDFIDRIVVNYLRHECSMYERLLDATFGKVGVDEASLRIKERVLDEIASTYPNLGTECMRQLFNAGAVFGSG